MVSNLFFFFFIIHDVGTLKWVEKMNWKDANLWHYASRYPLVVQEIIEGYEKSYGNFAMYWVNRAGHMVNNSYKLNFNYWL